MRPPASSEKKYDLEEVEVWLFLASVFGILLAIISYQLCKLCRIRVWKAKGDICRVETQKVIDSVIEDGLQTVAKTKKVVVMNIHLVPCSHNLQPQVTELTPNGAVIANPAKICRQNLNY